MGRWIRFLLAVLLGAAGGIFYAWVVRPPAVSGASPQSLRIDYKTDYVLMVAESYQADGDLGLAVRRLALLGEAVPGDAVGRALQFAQEQGYAEADLALMLALGRALGLPEVATGSPVP